MSKVKFWQFWVAKISALVNLQKCKMTQIFLYDISKKIRWQFWAILNVKTLHFIKITTSKLSKFVKNCLHFSHWLKNQHFHPNISYFYRRPQCGQMWALELSQDHFWPTSWGCRETLRAGQGWGRCPARHGHLILANPRRTGKFFTKNLVKSCQNLLKLEISRQISSKPVRIGKISSNRIKSCYKWKMTQFDEIFPILTGLDNIWLEISNFNKFWLDLTRFFMIWRVFSCFSDHIDDTNVRRRA